MTKQQEKTKKIKLKQVIKDMGFNEYEEVYVYIYGKPDSDQLLAIKDIDRSLLNRECMLVQPNHGGQEYNYSKYKFILK